MVFDYRLTEEVGECVGSCIICVQQLNKLVDHDDSIPYLVREKFAWSGEIS